MTRTRRLIVAQLACVLVFALLACEQKPQTPPSAPSAPAPAAPAKSAATVAVPAPVPAAPAAAAIPSGQTTPEGVACDLARSFVTSDSKLLRASCFVITPGTPERDAYNNYLDQTVMLMDVGNAVPSDNRDWPGAITRVYRARNLSSAGPAAFGLDQLGLTAVRFVDLRVTLRAGTAALRRTLVVQDEGSKLWFAVPHPEHFPKLSEGLNEEAESTEEWKP